MVIRGVQLMQGNVSARQFIFELFPRLLEELPVDIGETVLRVVHQEVQGLRPVENRGLHDLRHAEGEARDDGAFPPAGVRFHAIIRRGGTVAQHPLRG